MPQNPTWTKTIQALESAGTIVPSTGSGLIAGSSPTLTWQDTSLSPNRYFRLQDTGSGFVLSTSTDGATFTTLDQLTDVTQTTIYRRLTGLVLDQTGMAAPTALAQRVTVGSEANPRYQIDTGGTQSWGPGGNTAVDTVLSRSAAAVLQVTGNIRGTVAPSNVADLTRKDYVDTGLALKLALAGGTLTGVLTLAADPASGLQAATKQYVDNKVGAGLFAEFSGAGAPASGTLSSSVTYVVGNLYLDTTNLNMWVCTTGGSNSSSAWSLVLNVTSSNAFVKVPGWYSGAGAPSGTTLLTGNYAIGDLYQDTTNNALYFCKQAGSTSTSTWAQSGAVASVSATSDASLVITPTTGAVTARANATSLITGMKLPAFYSGAGDPTSSTLSAGTYGLGDIYFDTTNIAYWHCMASGSNSTSVWGPLHISRDPSGSTSLPTGATHQPFQNFPYIILYSKDSNGKPVVIQAINDALDLMSNMMETGTPQVNSQFTYIITASAAQLSVQRGGLYWSVAPSGTGGNQVTALKTIFQVSPNAGGTDGNTVVGAQAAVATTATDGFLYIPSCAGAPTGTPTSFTGKVAMIYDSTNNNFYIYNGGWKKVGLV